MKKRFYRALIRYLYVLTYFLAYLLSLVFFRLDIKGRGNVPSEGKLLVVARHDSYWDPPLIGLAFGWYNRVQFIARRGLLRNPLFRFPVTFFATTIDRDNFGKSDLRKILETFKEERIVCILPEGTTKSGASPKRGAIRMAERTGNKFIPVKINFERKPSEFPFLLAPVELIIGRPFSLDQLKKEFEEQAEGSSGEGPGSNPELSQFLMKKIDGLV